MVNVTLKVDSDKGLINRNIYGHFSEHLGRCIYEGLWVGEDSSIPNTEGIRNDVLTALQKLNIPVLRWPGGCFADEYHWKDGVGPKSERARMINTHWGGVEENNHFGTHEFMRLCELLGAEPYISGNLGSGTVQEMQEWVEYITFDGESPMANWRKQNGREEPWKLKYFGVGNENWGCGGNMRPEYYADEYRRYATYVRNYSGNQIYKIACGPNDSNYEWMEVLMREAARFMDGISLHYYTIPTGVWDDKGAATGFGEAEWFATLKKTLFMDELLVKHSEIMDKYDASAALIGEGPATKDLIQITGRDFTVVNWISIGMVFVIILLVLKSASLPVILVLAIEFAIILNLGICGYTGLELPFIVPVLISTIQLGSTVDYAILLSTRYKQERIGGRKKRDAIEEAAHTSIPSIIVSALGFFTATVGVAVYSDIAIISTVCGLMARGAVISMFTVIFLLPSLLMASDKLICRTTVGMKESINEHSPVNGDAAIC